MTPPRSSARPLALALAIWAGLACAHAVAACGPSPARTRGPSWTGPRPRGPEPLVVVEGGGGELLEGPTAPAGSEPTGGGSRAGGASAAAPGGQTGSGAQAPPPACPSTYAVAQALDLPCEGPSLQLECAYPEGDCYCGERPRCSGAAPGHQERPGWVCLASGPTGGPAGCPRRQPADGTPCDGPRGQCHYGRCGGSGVRCEDGRWRTVSVTPPPPGAAR